MAPPFGLQITFYLFLAGVASGSALVACATVHRADARAFATGKRCLLLTIIAMALGILCLISDLANPRDFILILTQANPHSAIAWGARIVLAFTLMAVFCWSLYRTKTRGSASRGERLALWILQLLALAVAIYPGFVLWQAEGVDLWNRWSMVPMLGFSGLHAGLAAGFLCSLGHRTAMPIGLLAVERMVLAALLVFACYFLIESGPWHHAMAYWALFLGAVLPIIILAKKPENAGILTGCCALAGSFLLRAWLIQDGQHLFF